MDADLTATGIEELDVFLGGGLPEGFTTMLLAPSGAGAEIFAKQFASGQRNARVVYVTTDESEREVLKTARDGRWPFDDVEMIDMQSRFADSMLEAQEQDQKQAKTARPKRTFDPRELVESTSSMDILGPGRKSKSPSKSSDDPEADYLRMLMDPFASLRPPARFVVHSLDFFLNIYPLERVVAALTALKAANSKRGGQMLWVLAKGAHGGTVERRLELLADCLIELEMTRKGTTFERFCMVKKVKNRSSGIGVSTYEITPEGFHLETLERIV